MNKSLPQILLLGCTVTAMGVIGYWLLFTQFMVYDDEGYVLWSLHNYFQEGGLYTKVYSQYGPFIYTLYHGIHSLFGLTFDNETGRLFTLFYWLGSASLGGLFAWRQTRSIGPTVGAMTLTFGCLVIMTSEPIHPGGILSMLAALGAVIGALALERGHLRFFAGLCGGVGAAMALTKINVGAFFLIAAGSWLAINHPAPKLGRFSLRLTAIASLLTPLWLMKGLWPDPWVAVFALIFSLAALSLVLLQQRAAQPQFGGNTWSYFIGAGITVGLVVLGVTWLRGTSLPMLWQGIVIAPMRQPVVYSHSAMWPALVPWFSLGMLVIALWVHMGNWPWRAPLIASLRLLVGAGLLVQSFHGIDNALTFFTFNYGLPFVWLMVVPLRGDYHSWATRARIWVAWVFIWQTLHAYPVAGSQMGWGAFLWVPLALVGWHEAVQFWAEKSGAFMRFIRGVGAAAPLAASAVLLLGLGYVSHHRYFLGQPIGLPGAANLRLSDDITSVYRIFNKNIRRHANLLYTYPGMFSLNIWTERPTPTATNVTHWFSLLNDQQQQDIIDRLETDDRAVVVVHDFLIRYLILHGFPPQGRLQQYLMQNFQASFRIDQLEFWVHNGREIAPLSTAQLWTEQASGNSRLILVTGNPGEIARIEIRGLFYPYNRVARVPNTDTTPWTITPLHDDNTEGGPGVTAPAPVRIQSLSRLEVNLAPGEKLPPLDLLKIILIDPTGHEIDSLLFTN